tara:strand:- start:450 stop:554 length:105 start_codon:yes stop_codon:yes gene_type:complete
MTAVAKAAASPVASKAHRAFDFLIILGYVLVFIG